MQNHTQLLKQVQELNKKKKFRQGIKLLTESVLEAQNSHGLYFESGFARSGNGEQQKAIEHLTKTIGIKPDYVEAYELRSYVGIN